MSLNSILNSAMSGLAASQAGMGAASNNIANVGTAGYARERVALSAGVTGGRTNGVLVGESQRIADRFLEAAVYGRAATSGRADVTAGYLDQLQAAIGQPGSAATLPARLDALTSSAIAMTASSTSPEAAAVFVGDVSSMLETLRQTDDDVAALRANAASEIEDTVTRVNGLLTQIHDLNDNIARSEGMGRSTAALASQRMSAIGDLGGLIGITVRDQPDGRVTIDAADGTVLLDRRLRQLTYPAASGSGLQTGSPPIGVRFAGEAGEQGPSTGDLIVSPQVGGKLGGLLDMRDRALPLFSEQLSVIGDALAYSLNAASNAATAVPAPNVLAGRNTGLVTADRLGFSGTASLSVTDGAGTLVAAASIDFSSLGPAATIADALAAINTGLGGAATASFSDGRFMLQATAPGNGVSVAQDPASPAVRAGMSFSHFFGLNDLIRSEAPLVPPGFQPSDAHGIAPGQSLGLELRDSGGRILASQSVSGASGPALADMLGELNAGPLSRFGGFSLDESGRLGFEPSAAGGGVTLAVTSDTTDRLGTGQPLSALLGLAPGPVSSMSVRADIAANPARLPLARVPAGAVLGQTVIGAGSNQGANAYVDHLAAPVALGRYGTATVGQAAARLISSAGAEASRAEETRAGASARLEDAVSRRDSFSGVNVDEELAQLVILQNSYSAAARVVATANDMYDTLLNMMR